MTSNTKTLLIKASDVILGDNIIKNYDVIDHGYDSLPQYLEIEQVIELYRFTNEIEINGKKHLRNSLIQIENPQLFNNDILVAKDLKVGNLVEIIQGYHYAQIISRRIIGSQIEIEYLNFNNTKFIETHSKLRKNLVVINESKYQLVERLTNIINELDYGNLNEKQINNKKLEKRILNVKIKANTRHNVDRKTYLEQLQRNLTLLERRKIKECKDTWIVSTKLQLVEDELKELN